MHIRQKLWYASAKGKTAEAKRLIAEGAPVDWEAKDGLGFTPVFMASSAGHTEIVMLLHEHKANINAKTDSTGGGDTPLHWAARNNKMDTVRALVEAGCNIGIRNSRGNTAAEDAKEEGHNKIADFLCVTSA